MKREARGTLFRSGGSPRPRKRPHPRRPKRASAESVTWKSIGGEASSTPDSPPSRKVIRKPTEKSIGVSNVNWPFHIVPIQLKNLIPVGTAIRNVMNEKNGSSTAPVA